MAIPCVFFSFLTGCATLIVDNALDRPRAYPSIEFQHQKKGFSLEFNGAYHHQTKINNQDYGVMQIKNADESCRQKSDIELLMPFGSAADLLGILREAPTYTSAGAPVKILFNPKPGREIGDVSSLLPPDTWKGYPAVIIMHGVQDGDGIITVAYRIGSDAGDIRIRVVDASELKWICRDREKYITSMISKPFTYAFDILTFPIAIIGAVIILSTGK